MLQLCALRCFRVLARVCWIALLAVATALTPLVLFACAHLASFLLAHGRAASASIPSISSRLSARRSARGQSARGQSAQGQSARGESARDESATGDSAVPEAEADTAEPSLWTVFSLVGGPWKQVAHSKVKLLMGFWQVFSVLPSVYGASAPDELSGWLQWTNFVNLDWMSSGLRIECAGDFGLRLWLRALVIPAIPVLSLVLVFVGAAYARPDKLAEEGLSEASPLHRACVVGWRSSLPYILMLVFTYLPNVTSLSKWPAVSTPQSQSE